MTHAEQNQLRSQKIAFRLDVVGNKGDAQEGVLYELVLVENDGSKRKVWGFGVEIIMEPPEPVDLSPIRHLKSLLIFSLGITSSSFILMGDRGEMLWPT